MKELPRSFGLVRARADVLVAGRTLRTPVTLEPMENPVEIGPGVTLLVTKTQADGIARVSHTRFASPNPAPERESHRSLSHWN